MQFQLLKILFSHTNEFYKAKQLRLPENYKNYQYTTIKMAVKKIINKYDLILLTFQYDDPQL